MSQPTGQDSAAGRAEFERRMEVRRRAEAEEEELEQIRRGWCVGGEAFRAGLLERMEDQVGDNHSGEPRVQGAQARAERIMGEELARLEWSEQELAARRKSDPEEAGHRPAG